MLLMFLILMVTSYCEKRDKEGSGPITDGDGNIYTSVKIGTQVWMTENLKTTKYNDGSEIPNVTGDSAWYHLTTAAYCFFNDDISYKTPYGGLYNFYAVATGKLCPIGWHVPTDDEWTTLMDDLGGAEVAGGKLKEAGTSHWISPNGGATNESGFTALPGGTHYDFFGYIGMNGYWWSSTEFSSANAWRCSINYETGNLYRSNYFKYCGHSVRCLKD